MADATAVSLRRGTSEEHINFRGNEGEVTVDTTNATVWVHLGNNLPGTPLATANLTNINTTNASVAIDPVSGQTTLVLKDYAKNDMSNVTRESVAVLGIAKTDMTNVNTVSLATSAGHFGKNLAYNDGSNTETAGLAERTEDVISTFGKNLAYADLTNVDLNTLTDKLDAENVYAKANMSNINTAALAESTEQYSHAGNNLAYANLSNIENLSSTTKEHLSGIGIQLTDNLTNTLNYSSISQYPSTKAVADAIDAIDSLPPLPLYDVHSNVKLRGYFPYQYTLTVNDGGTGYEPKDQITVKDITNNATFNLQVDEVDYEHDNAILSIVLLTNFGSTSYSGTAVHYDTSDSTITTGAHLSNLYVNGIILKERELTENTTYTFTYDGTDWIFSGTSEAADLGYYGITVEGIPEENDELTIIYFSNATFTISSNATSVEKLQWQRNKPTIEDIVVDEEDGKITVILSDLPLAISIKGLIGGEEIEGEWSKLNTLMLFTPTEPESTLSNAWVIKVN